MKLSGRGALLISYLGLALIPILSGGACIDDACDQRSIRAAALCVHRTRERQGCTDIHACQIASTPWFRWSRAEGALFACSNDVPCGCLKSAPNLQCSLRVDLPDRLCGGGERSYSSSEISDSQSAVQESLSRAEYVARGARAQEQRALIARGSRGRLPKEAGGGARARGGRGRARIGGDALKERKLAGDKDGGTKDFLTEQMRLGDTHGLGWVGRAGEEEMAREDVAEADLEEATAESLLIRVNQEVF